MGLRVADPVVRVLTLVLAVALVTTPAAGVASGGTAPLDDHVVPTRGGLASSEDCVISGECEGYPDKLSVDCTPTTENASVVLETSGGWGYVVSLNASSPVRVPKSDFQVSDAGTGDATDTAVEPGETALIGPVAANKQLTDVLKQEWLSHLDPAGDDAKIVTQTGVTALPGDPGESEARYYRSRPSNVRLDRFATDEAGVDTDTAVIYFRACAGRN